MVRSRSVAAVVVALLAVVGVSCSSTGTQQAQGDASTTAAPPSTEAPREAPKRIPLDKLIDTSFESIEAYWTETFPEVYGDEYEPISGGFHPYSPDNPPVSCGGIDFTYEEFADNAFYCQPDDLIMWDEVGLISDLYDTYGQFTVAFVFAHEWGHAIQNRSGMWRKNDQISTIVFELQADCFAAAWARDAMDSGGELSFGQSDIPLMVAGALELADPVGNDPTADMAHGSAFDRLGAMEEGFNQGPERCAEYEDPDKFPAVFEEVFTDPEDFDNEGNAPYDDILPAAVADLDAYWQDLSDAAEHDWIPIGDVVGYAGDEGKYPACGDERLTKAQAVGAVVFCPDDNVVLYDDDFTREVHGDIGDFGMIILFAHQWAVAFQVQNGQTAGDLYTALQESCFTGTWTASVVRGDRVTEDEGLSLSPGDLDEGLAAFLAFSEQPDEQGNTEKGNAFQRIEAFRDGFLNGLDGELVGEQVCAKYTVEQASDGRS